MPAANPHRGEVAFTAGGQERILRLGVNEICALEDELGLSFREMFERLANNPSMQVIRTVFRRAVIDADLSAEEAGALIDELTAAHAIELLMQSFMRASPEPEPAKGNGVRPRKGIVAGTGKSSSLTGSP